VTIAASPTTAARYRAAPVAPRHPTPRKPQVDRASPPANPGRPRATPTHAIRTGAPIES
jgi:hypothetical protein